MMEMFIFPFKEVEKGSRIVIYGAGLVGTDYLNQVKASEYCDVAFIAAKDRVLSALALAITIGIPGTIFALFLSS